MGTPHKAAIGLLDFNFNFFFSLSSAIGGRGQADVTSERKTGESAEARGIGKQFNMHLIAGVS